MTKLRIVTGQRLRRNPQLLPWGRGENEGRRRWCLQHIQQIVSTMGQMNQAIRRSPTIVYSTIRVIASHTATSHSDTPLATWSGIPNSKRIPGPRTHGSSDLTFPHIPIRRSLLSPRALSTVLCETPTPYSSLNSDPLRASWQAQ